MKRKLAILLTLALLLSILQGFSIHNVQAASSYGARAEYGGENGTELFLGGKYIELGISNWGDFGTVGNKPSGFRGTDKRGNLGMSADHDGFGNGYDLPIDYYLPGTTEERFAVGYKVGTSTNTKSNSALMGSKEMPTVVINESEISNGKLKAKIVSTWTDNMEITQIVSFHEDDKYYRNDVTIKNISSSSWDSARYMRSMDPDNTVDQGGSYTTANTVTYTYAEDGFSVVQAETTDNSDRLYVALGTRAPIFFFSGDPAVKTSVFGFTNKNPYASEAYDSPRAKGSTVIADAGITITWDSGPLASQESKSFTYFTSLDERPFEEVLLEIDPNTGVQETEANDGTVYGKQRVAVKGHKLIDTIDPSLIKINNLPSGIDFTVKRLSDTLLEFYFSGAALHHSSEYSINNASITIGKELIVDGKNDYTAEPFGVKFKDPAHAYINQVTVTDAVYGVYGDDDFVTIKLLNSNFTEEVTNGDIVVNNLLPGLVPNVTRISDTEIRIDFSGTVASPYDVEDASVTIAAHALIGSNGDLTTNTFKIDVGVKEPNLVITYPVLYESEVNGVISGELLVNLINGTFANPTVTESVYGINLPASLTIGSVERVSDTQLKVLFAGEAVHSNAIHSITNARISVDKSSIIATNEHTNADAVLTNTFAIFFYDSLVSLDAVESIIHDNLDGTVSETLTVNLIGGTFASDITGGVTVNNLPEGLGFTTERINDTTLKITFTGAATKYNPASAFASVSVAANVVNGSDYVITSDSFDLKAPSHLTLVTWDLTSLTWDMIKVKNSAQDNVRVNLDLIEVGENNTEISWASSHPSVISTDGTVVRPAINATDVEVVLTATISHGDVKQTKTFTVVVKKLSAVIELINVVVEDNKPNEAILTFDKDLSRSLTPGDFAGLTIAGKTVTGVVINGKTSTITLSEVIAPSESLTVTYDPSVGNIIGTTGAASELAEITSANQTFSTTNNVKPIALVSVTVEDTNPDEAILVFSKDLASTLTVDDFAGLTIAGKTVTGVVINGKTATVTLSESIAPSEVLIVTYDAHVGNVIGTTGVTSELPEITSSNQSGFTITNNVKPIALMSVTVEDNKPNEAVLVFSKDLATTLKAADFAGLTIAGKTVTGVVISGKIATVTLSESIAPSEVLTVTYNPSVGNIITAEGNRNEIAVISASDQAGITSSNTVVQLDLVSGYVSDGKMKLVFNKDVDGVSLDLSGLKYGGVAVSRPFEIIGNELIVTLPKQHQNDVLTFETGKIQASNNENNTLELNIPGIDFGSSQSYINAKGKMTNDTLKFISDDIALELNPAFNKDKPNSYKAFVQYEIDRIQLDAIPTHQVGTIVKVTIDGEEIDVANKEELPLQMGTNVVKIGLYDASNPSILLGQYEITINRAYPRSGLSSSVIDVNVVIDGNQQEGITKIEVNRITNPDGKITDTVEYTKEKALEVVNKAKQSGSSISRIVIPDAEDKVSEVHVNIPLESAKMLQENGIDLEIYTENAMIRLPQSSLVELEGDFYFRVVPVKDEDERQEIEDRARIEKVVREAAGNNSIEIVARPMTIETNLPSRPVELVLPLKNVAIPTNAIERAVFLAQLGIFIEHSDGEKNIAIPEVVTLIDGTLGLKFTINKFSTFTIFNFNNVLHGQHTAYITGYPDGEFKPEYSTTRAQMALMLARNLGFDQKSVLDYKPFEDVAASHYAAAAIDFVNKAGIMIGDPDGKFRADDMIKRAEMASLVKNYLKLAEVENKQLSFSDTTGHWAQHIIEANVEAGVLSGYPDGSFRPNANLTRAEAVTIINHMFDRGPLNGVNKSSFIDVSTSHWAFGHIEEAAFDHNYLLDLQGKEQIIRK